MMEGLYRYLDASNGHITVHDNELLIAKADLPFRYTAHEYGYTIWLSSELERQDLKESGISDDFVTLIMYAKDLHCGIINLDSDGERHPELHLNNW